MNKQLNVAGTQYNTQYSQLLVSTGIHSLDDIIGGGLPLGTVTLLEQDLHGLYAEIIFKYFLAEGVANKQSILVASNDIDPQTIVREIPAFRVLEKTNNSSANVNPATKMKIAFRYQNLPINNEVYDSGYHFDLSQRMSDAELEDLVEYWNGDNVENDNSANVFSNAAYHDLLKNIKRRLKGRTFFSKNNSTTQSVLRIGIHCVGSAVWLSNASSGKKGDLEKFIFCLRALVQNTFATAVVILPSNLFDEDQLRRCIHSVDISMKLEAFAGTELENNSSLSGFHGFFYINKLAAVNSLDSKYTNSSDFVFTLKRTKLCIEKLCLPPGIQESNKDKNETFLDGTSPANTLLEF